MTPMSAKNDHNFKSCLSCSCIFQADCWLSFHAFFNRWTIFKSLRQYHFANNKQMLKTQKQLYRQTLSFQGWIRVVFKNVRPWVQIFINVQIVFSSLDLLVQILCNNMIFSKKCWCKCTHTNDILDLIT